ncbi:MAG: HD domain-containing protein [Crocinitomicaceae bacterium]|nr:HD domain-containing protein [Crocinitomicaceae bacterium]MBK8926105.1 HD domain-containing protein [Crocinitomicaceae bacterium]
MEHPYFQRLRRIKQLGLSHLVYPGANHTRFHHAIGAMHLMVKAIDVLRKKQVDISEDERLGAIIAILLHDIGHGPFSHTLEHSLLDGVHHEEVSLLFMEELNRQYHGKLNTAIEIFTNQHPKKFLHQLVSGQLDMDRLDYLQRDSYFTGVEEGVIGSERIITMLDVVDNNLVIEEKGIYSIENFIGARRIMYWQVYMHKTVVASEYMLTSILNRAKELYRQGIDLFASPSLKLFLQHQVTRQDFIAGSNWLENFALIDDNDVITSVKVWQTCDDKILATLCKMILSRKLFKTEITKGAVHDNRYRQQVSDICRHMGIEEKDVHYFVIKETLVNSAYDERDKQIIILTRSGETIDIAQASDNLNIVALSKPVEKSCFCYARFS